ncbi:MAG: SpoIIE family protein phosphatase [Bacteroidetes bacterium]|nr:SpoIIE family protein phosphatase [Bacteroidota bacterium]
MCKFPLLFKEMHNTPRNIFEITAINSKFFLLYAIAICFSFSLSAQKLPFTNYTTENGLSASQVLCVFQDDDNTLWLGTNNGGINKFNGVNFKIIGKKEGLPDQTIFDIKKYGESYYIATNSGLAVLTNDSVKVFGKEQGLNHARVFKTFKDSKNNIWVATQEGTQLLVHNSLAQIKDSIVGKKAVYNIYEDSKGNIWFCTLFDGLIKFDGQDYTPFSLDSIAIYNGVFSILEVGENTYWFAGRKGLHQLKNNEITKIDNPSFDIDIQFYHISKDSRQNIWLGSNDGAFVYRKNKFEHFTMDNGLVDNVIWQIKEDNEKSLWFISNVNGISSLSSEEFMNYDTGKQFNSNNINSIVPLENGLFCIGTSNGFSLYKPEENSFTKVDLTKIKREYFGNEVLSGTYDKINKILWLGTNNGLMKFENDKYVATYYHEDNVNKSTKCRAVLLDNNNKLWIGTASGICHLENNLVVRWNDPNNPPLDVFTIFQDQNNTLYFGLEEGLMIKDKNTVKIFKKKEGFTNTRVRCIAQDIHKDLWFAANEGIFQYKNKVFKRIAIENHSELDAFYSFTFDHQNNLWAGLPNGVLKITLNGNKTKSIFFSKDDGFLGKECNNNAIYVDKLNHIWFGSSHGLTIFRPEFYIDYKLKPKLNLKIKVLGNEDLLAEYSDGIDAHGLPINLELPPSLNHLTFEFSAISLKEQKNLRYSFILHGNDKTWSLDQNVNSTIYSQLPPGDYTFEVKIGDNHKLEKQASIKFSFTIKKPFYKTTWFLALCLIIIGTWIYSYTRIRKVLSVVRGQKNIIEEQKNVSIQKNKEILGSITYAKRIQQAMLPKATQVDEYLQNYFIVYLPKDIVSGDFYFTERKGNKTYFSAADCTGHGVPGALMSVLCSNLLSRAIKDMDISSPAEILDMVTVLLLQRFQDSGENVKDGMDLALCSIDSETLTLEYSGANNPLLVLRKGEPIMIKADFQPIGSFVHRQSFTNHTIQLEKGDIIYVTTDGYSDQFGGPSGKKLKSKAFRELLISICDKDMSTQKRLVEEYFIQWKGNLDQVDDVCVFGVQV